MKNSQVHLIDSASSTLYFLPRQLAFETVNHFKEFLSIKFIFVWSLFTLLLTCDSSADLFTRLLPRLCSYSNSESTLLLSFYLLEVGSLTVTLSGFFNFFVFLFPWRWAPIIWVNLISSWCFSHYTLWSNIFSILDDFRGENIFSCLLLLLEITKRRTSSSNKWPLFITFQHLFHRYLLTDVVNTSFINWQLDSFICNLKRIYCLS